MKNTSIINTVKKPIFVLGVPHSGTSWLGRVISQHPDIAYLPEANFVWMWGNAHKENDLLTAEDLTPRIKDHIYKKICRHVRSEGALRVCDKTPRNSLRIPFIYSLFPDAKIILIIRDGRSVIRSINTRSLKPSRKVLGLEVWRRIKRVPPWELGVYLHRTQSIFKGLIGQSMDYWGARPPGWETWVKQYSPHVVAAKQWTETTRISIVEGRKLPQDNYIELRYEEVIQNPVEHMSKIVNFLELEHSTNLIVDYAKQTADPSRLEKWREVLDDELLSDIQFVMEPTMIEVGYQW